MPDKVQSSAKQKLPRTRLERSTPVATADFYSDFKQLSDLCEFNASMKNLIKLTGHPQMNQNSWIHISNYLFYLI